MKTLGRSLAFAACVFVLGASCLANTQYLDANSEVSYVRLSGPNISSLGGGYNEWSSVFQVTNTASTPLSLYWYWTASYPVDPGNSTQEQMTWDNTTQQWQYTDLAGQLMTAQTLTPATYIDFSNTNLPFPSSGFASTDSLPIYYLGVVPAGGSVTFTWDRKLTSNIGQFYNGFDFLTTAPEPSSLYLLGAGLLGCLGLLRRKRHEAGTLTTDL